MASVTGLKLPYPQSTDDVRPYEDIELLAKAVDLLTNLPDSVEAHVSNVIANISATSFAALPSPGPCTVQFTNPRSDLDLEVDVTISCWASNGTSSNVQIGLAAFNGMSFTPTAFGSGGQVANGENIIVGGGATVQGQTTVPVVIPAGAATVTFAVNALRSGGTTTTLPSVNYPVIRVKPRRFMVP